MSFIPLRCFFDCSTGHLSAKSRTYLDDQAARSAIHPESWVARTPYGWFVWAQEEPDQQIPPNLSSLMQHARQRGADYILFDADAPQAPDLPVFDGSD